LINKMQKSASILIVFLLSFTLIGCSHVYIPAETDNLPEIKYMKDSRGLCYAYTGSRLAYDYVAFSISKVTCKEAGL
jgi:hypothetical protein